MTDQIDLKKDTPDLLPRRPIVEVEDPSADKQKHNSIETAFVGTPINRLEVATSLDGYQLVIKQKLQPGDIFGLEKAIISQREAEALEGARGLDVSESSSVHGQALEATRVEAEALDKIIELFDQYCESNDVFTVELGESADPVIPRQGEHFLIPQVTGPDLLKIFKTHPEYGYEVEELKVGDRSVGFEVKKNGGWSDLVFIYGQEKAVDEKVSTPEVSIDNADEPELALAA